VYGGDWLIRLNELVRDSRSPRHWQVPANVWGLGVTSMLTDVSSEMVLSVLPAYLVMSGGLAPLALGIAAGMHEGGPMLAAWAGGLIADRSGKRKLTAGCGYALSAICRLGWFAQSGRAIAAIALLVLGDRVGKAIRTAPRDAIISLSVRPSQLATAFGVHRALDAAGAAFGPLLAFALLWRLPHRYDVIFFASFVVALLGVAALVLLVDEAPLQHRDVGADMHLASRDVLAVFGDRSLRPVLILATAFALVTISDAFIYLLLVQRSHAGPQWIPLLYTGTALAFLALAVPVGYLADRIGRRSVFVFGHLLLVLAYAAAFGGLSQWPWNAVMCVALLGGYYACSDGVLAGLASSLLPADTRAMGLAWVATGVSAGRLCSAMAFGLLWTRAGDRIAIAAFTTALVAVLLAAVASRGIGGAVAS
jgi:MFS family permease